MHQLDNIERKPDVNASCPHQISADMHARRKPLNLRLPRYYHAQERQSFVPQEQSYKDSQACAWKPSAVRDEKVCFTRKRKKVGRLMTFCQHYRTKAAAGIGVSKNLHM